MSQFILENQTIFWIIIAIFFVLIEALAMGLITIWFAVGAFVAGILALFGVPFKFQIAVCIIVSLLLLIFAKPIAKKKLKIGAVKTNVGALIGKKGLVIEDIFPHETGQVKVNGIVWTALAKDGDIKIEKDEEVIVCEVEGVKLLVEREEKEGN